MQRIFQYAGQTAGFLFTHSTAADNRVASVDGCLNNGRGLDPTIEDDGESVPYVRRRDIAESLRAFAVEIQSDFPSFVAITSASVTHVLSPKVGFFLYKQPFFSWFFVSFRGHLVNLDPVVRRNHVLTCVDVLQALSIVGVNHPKLESCHTRQLIARFLNLGSIQSWDLNKDAIDTDGTDDWFAAAKIIHALSNDFHRLTKHSLCHFLVAFHQSNKK